MTPPSCLRVVEDANHATRTSVHPQEGQFVLLMDDRNFPVTDDRALTLANAAAILGGCYVLIAASSNAKKVALSTLMG
eukprot:4470113-Pyramimonas_sp.AAC.1